MRLRGAAHLGILIVLTALGTCVSVAHQVPANDVDLEAADDGGSGSQQIFYNPVDSTSLNHVVDPVQRNTREGGLADPYRIYRRCLADLVLLVWHLQPIDSTHRP